MQKRMLSGSILLLFVLASLSVACAGGTAFPNLFATATPTFTLTPTVTPSPIPTLTPTPSPTITPPPGGMTLEKQEDGSTLYRDYNSGLEIHIPSSWVAVRATMADIQKVAEQLGNDNPEIAGAVEALESMDPELLRLIALDSKREHYRGGYVPNFTVIQMKDPLSVSLPMQMLLDLTAEGIKSRAQNVEVLSTSVQQNSNGVELGILQVNISVDLPQGATLNAFQKQVYVVHQDYAMVITFSTPKNIAETTTALFDEVVDTIQFIEP